jgi:hypothetical protein
MKVEENIKIKNFLKNMFENQEFETSFEDEVFSWNGDVDEPEYEKYIFKYYMEIGEVLGEGTETVAGINVIITDILKDGEDYYYDWEENSFSEGMWYINHLEDVIFEEKMKDIPISIYLTFYGYDEYEFTF